MLFVQGFEWTVQKEDENEGRKKKGMAFIQQHLIVFALIFALIRTGSLIMLGHFLWNSWKNICV